MFGRLLALFRQAENTLGTDAIPPPTGRPLAACAPHVLPHPAPHACRVTAIYQVVFVNDEYFAPWSAADYFCEFTYLAIGRYYYADVATVQGTVGGRVLCRESIDHKHHRITRSQHTKALWRWPVGRNTASQDAHERRMCSRGASGTYGAKMPGSGDLMESEYRIGVPVLRYKAWAFCMRVRAEPQCELCVCYENFG